MDKIIHNYRKMGNLLSYNEFKVQCSDIIDYTNVPQELIEHFAKYPILSPPINTIEGKFIKR